MDKLSMSLEDMIKAAPPKTGKGKGKGGKKEGESTGRGGAMKKDASKTARAVAAPYGAKPKKTLSSMYEESSKGAAAVVGLTTGTKVQVANLDFNVSKEDIEELFRDVATGKLKSVTMVKKGVAQVVYQKRADAEKAIETYDGVPLDGRALRLTILSNAAAPEPAARVVVVAGKGGRGRGAGAAGGRTVVKPAAEAPAKGGRGGKGKGRGGGKGGGKGKGEKPKVEDLDADLDSYRAANA